MKNTYSFQKNIHTIPVLHTKVYILLSIQLMILKLLIFDRYFIYCSIHLKQHLLLRKYFNIPIIINSLYKAFGLYFLTNMLLY